MLFMPTADASTQTDECSIFGQMDMRNTRKLQARKEKRSVCTSRSQTSHSSVSSHHCSSHNLSRLCLVLMWHRSDCVCVCVFHDDEACACVRARSRQCVSRAARWRKSATHVLFESSKLHQLSGHRSNVRGFSAPSSSMRKKNRETVWRRIQLSPERWLTEVTPFKTTVLNLTTTTHRGVTTWMFL